VANNLSDYGLTKVSLDDYSSTELASSVYDVQAVAVGQSGIVYFTDDDGKVWSIDPDVTSTATQLALAPGFDEQFGLALAEGALMISSRGFGEVYRYPVNDGPIQHPSLGDMVAYLDLEQIDAAPGEAFEVPLVLASTEESDLPVAAFQSELNWQPSELNYITNREGDFNGAFVANDTEASQDISILFHELVDETGENLLPGLYVDTPASIGMGEGMGDVTGDGAIGAADAVQILRWLVGLPICDGCDISSGDTNCDDVIAAADAVTILRWLVGLPVGDACIGIPRIGPCPE
jgi:hypothetical protein